MRLILTSTAIAALALCGATPAAADPARFECLVEPFVEVRLSSAVEGLIDEILVERGDRVAAGQVVARLKSNAEKAHLDLVVARAEFAARKAERNEDLYLRQMISPHEKDELETDAKLLGLEVREVRERLEMRSVRSPIEGVVVERMFAPGEFVNDEPLLRLAQVDPLRVETALPVRYYGSLRVGMTGRVEWETPGMSTRNATITVVDPVVDAASGTIGVRLELRNADRKLPAGTKCWVTFDIESR